MMSEWKQQARQHLCVCLILEGVREIKAQLEVIAVVVVFKM